MHCVVSLDSFLIRLMFFSAVIPALCPWRWLVCSCAAACCSSCVVWAAALPRCCPSLAQVVEPRIALGCCCGGFRQVPPALLLSLSVQLVHSLAAQLLLLWAACSAAVPAPLWASSLLCSVMSRFAGCITSSQAACPRAVPGWRAGKSVGLLLQWFGAVLSCSFTVVGCLPCCPAAAAALWSPACCAACAVACMCCFRLGRSPFHLGYNENLKLQ